MQKIVISTGGTGGHVIPAQILYDYLSDKNEVTIIIDKRGVKYIEKKKYKTKQIDVPKKNQNFLTLIPFLFSFILSIFNSYLFLRKKKNQYINIYRWLYVSTYLLGCKVLKFKDIFIRTKLSFG